MGDLILSQANESHEGSYLCQAKNGIGSSGKSKLITIKVDGKDIILTYTYKTNILNKEKQNTNTQCAEVFNKKVQFLDDARLESTTLRRKLRKNK